MLELYEHLGVLECGESVLPRYSDLMQLSLKVKTHDCAQKCIAHQTGPPKLSNIYTTDLAYPNLLGFLLLVPPNFNLVASMTLTILLLNALPSLPSMIFESASLPGPKSLKISSNCRICPPFP